MTEEHTADCGLESSCPVRTNWQRITEAIRGALEAVTLDEMRMDFPIDATALRTGAATRPSDAEAVDD